MSSTRVAMTPGSTFRSFSGKPMFCATVMCGNSASFWNTMEVGRSAAGTPAMSSPSMRIVPEVVSSKPATCFRSVVLPQPEGPTRAMNSPCRTSSDTPFSAG